jgi:hypothetical protein
MEDCDKFGPSVTSIIIIMEGWVGTLGGRKWSHTAVVNAKVNNAEAVKS